MSLILEALRKSERERAGAPGAPSPVAVPRRQPMPLPQRRRLGIGIALALGMAVLALVWLLRDDGPQGPTGPAVVDPAPSAVEPLASAAPPAPPATAPVSPEGRPGPHPGPAHETAAEEPEVIDLAAQLEPRPPAAPKAPPALAEPPPSTVPALAEMPLEFQETVPSLDIQVHFYARDPDRRFVLIGGQRFRGGEQIMPGLDLDEIVREGLVVEWRGERFIMPARR
ncbi:MAG: general secretion pathway protein GspB [Chromatiales bacterium]|jgi:hypothetical protein